MMSLHLMPGIYNLLIFDRVRFSEDSLPFTMYVNLDKTVAGLFAYQFFVLPYQAERFRREHFMVVVKSLAVVCALLLPLALFTGYVRLDFKFPEETWVWAANNLFLVCMAEECLFRGLIQGGLERRFPKLPAAVSIGTATVLFGIAHFQGGLTYIALASVAGLVYGYAYWKTKRIEAAMLVHFGLNLVHFLAFSYPALAR